MYEHLIKEYFVEGVRFRKIREFGAETVRVEEKGYYCQLCRNTPHKVFLTSKSKAIRHLEKVHGMNLNLSLTQFLEG